MWRREIRLVSAASNRVLRGTGHTHTGGNVIGRGRVLDLNIVFSRTSAEYYNRNALLMHN